MKRIETLVKEAHAHLDANQYVADHKASKNGVAPMDIARAIDAIQRAEKTLRRAFEVSAPDEAARCKCGEPEDGGEFGWFDHEDGNTYCNACGTKI